MAFKSKAMQDLQARKAAALADSIAREFSSLKEKVERLTGDRGADRAVKQSDLKAFAASALKCNPTTVGVRVSSEYAWRLLSTDERVDAIRQDILALQKIIISIVGAK